MFAINLTSEEETKIRDVIALLLGNQKKAKGMQKSEIQQVVQNQFVDGMQYD